MGKRMSREEREAHDARVDETIRRLRELAEKAQAELDAKKAREQQQSA